MASRPALYGMYVLYSALIVVVLVAWGLVCLCAGAFVCRPLPGSLALLAKAICVAVPLVVGWVFSRHLLRTHVRRWIRDAIAVAAAPFALCVATVVVLSLVLNEYELKGPTSQDGLTPVVAVRNAWGDFLPEFNSDVRVVDAAGATVATWVDHDGWQDRSGPERQRDSMRWTAPHELEFTTKAGVVKLSVR
jgi:hypothetical protein